MKKIKTQIIQLQLSISKELTRYSIIFGILLVGFVVASFLTKMYQLLIVMAVMEVLFTYIYFSRYGAMIKKQKQDNLLEFVNLFTFFRIYLKNGFGVYSSLKEISSFANPSLKLLIEKLLVDIDEDKSITPYINFAHNFDELIVEEMMISIYQMVDDGSNSNYLMQFELIFDKFSELLHQNLLNTKDRKLGGLTITSLLGSAYLIVMITFGVISLLGDMLNGI